MENVVAEKFFDYVRNCENGKVSTEEEQLYLDAYKTFQRSGAVAWPVFKKIQNQKLILVREALSRTDALVLGQYLQQSAETKESNLRVLEIKNCGLSNSCLAEILTGVAAQPRIS